MKELDISILIGKGYLKAELHCPTSEKNTYKSIGNLRKEGIISCGKTIEDTYEYHGIPVDPRKVPEERLKALLANDLPDQPK